MTRLRTPRSVRIACDQPAIKVNVEASQLSENPSRPGRHPSIQAMKEPVKPGAETKFVQGSAATAPVLTRLVR